MKPRRCATPPRGADRLLATALPQGLLGSTIIGDLHQEHEERARHQGPSRLWLWYWLQALKLAARYAWRGFRRPASSYRRLTENPNRDPREESTESIMSALITDFRYGLRTLVKSPLLSLVAVLTMALGISQTVFTFSQVYGSVMRGIPVPADDRLISVMAQNPERRISQTTISYPDYLEFRQRATLLEDLAAFSQGSLNLASEGTTPERYSAAWMSANALEHLGVPPLLGRTFLPQESEPEAPAVIVLSYGVWQNRFAGNPEIVGQSIRANGEDAEVIGVMPEGFAFPVWEEAWLNLRLDPDAVPRRSNRVMTFGRLRAGVTIPAVASELTAIAERIEAEHPDEPTGYRPLVRLHERVHMPREVTAVLYLMLGAVFGVLMIACSNVANLLLARASVRSREIAIRSALGASRWRVVRQLLMESFVLAMAGGVIGLAGAQVMLKMYDASLAGIQKPYWIDMSIDANGVLFAIGTVLLTALLAGTLPAFRASGIGAGAILQDETRGSSSLRMGRISSFLVVSEIAVSCALLLTAGLMIRSVININRVDLGFRTDNIVTGRIALFESDYPGRGERQQLFSDLIARLRQEPGVQSATLTSSLPGTESGQWAVAIEGRAYDTDGDVPTVGGTVVGTQFFDTFGVQLSEGREFMESETGSGAEPAVIVNRSFVQRFLPDQQALGQRIRLPTDDPDGPWVRVVGVVPDLHVGGGVGGLGSDRLSPEHIYLSPGAVDARFLTVAIRSRVAAETLVPRIRAVLAQLDPDLPLYEVRTMQQALEQHTWAFTLFGRLFTLLGISALFMATVGLYGVMAFSVSRRRQEIGIRMALGATADRILLLVLRKGLIQLGIGLAIGLALGYAMARPLRAVTYGVEASDPATYLVITLALLATGLIATLLPARSATRVDPNTALRAR